MKLVIQISFCFLLLSSTAVAQQTKIYSDNYVQFKDGMELYDKFQYQAAQKKFNEIIDKIDHPQDEIRIDAEYYSAICALELYNLDAEYLLNKFVYDHPDNVRTKTVFFNLGTHHYRRKRYHGVIKYFEKVDKYELSYDQRMEYHFKLGYSAFKAKDFNMARDNFLEVKDQETEYKVPARYYYAHIAYANNQNQLALEGFRSIDKDPNFKAIVPYYIGQILYRQKKYKEVTEYGPSHYTGVSIKRKSEFAHIIGDSYYRMGLYTEAIPYLEEYNSFERSTREDNYQMGYTYYKTMDYPSAIKYLSKVKSLPDSLAQIAFYQLGDAYIKNDQKDYARNAFKAASQLSFDKEVEEEALWSYAKLAYELSYNPYDEAIDAFHKFIDTYPTSHRVDDAYEFLLNVYTTTKNYEAALESISRIKNKNEKMKKAFQIISYNRGVELFHNRKYNAAIKSFDDSRIYKVDKILSSGAVYWQAESNFGMGKFTQAIPKYVAFKSEPGSILTGKRALADYNLGYCYLRGENHSASITAFRQFVQGATSEQKDRKADALLRIADNYYLLKEDDEAIKNYQRALDLSVRSGDYAYYQMAKSQGYKSDLAGKIKSLTNLLDQYPESSYHIAAVYELGQAYLVQNNNAKALTYFEEIVANHSENGKAKDALFNIGVIHFRNKNYLRAKDVFNQVVDQYPKAEIRNAAIIQMKEVYKALDQLDEYVAWLRSKGIDASFEELDNEYYIMALDEYDKQPRDCYKVIERFQNYVTKIPKPKHEMTAYFRIAQCNYTLQKFEEAVVAYNKVTVGASNEFKEQSLAEAAEINFYKLKDFHAALSDYSNLEKVALEGENVNKSLIGQMRCFFKLNNFQFAKNYARKVLNKIRDDEKLTVEAQFIEGISLKELAQYSAALIALRKTTELTKSARGAEAKYSIAEIFFIQDKLDDCEKEIQELVQQKPGYDYWLAKGILLLSDVYVKKGDYFNARYSLESVINGYKGDDDIIPTAQAKLGELDDLENQGKSIEEEDDSEEIDLGGDGDNGFQDDDGNEPKEEKEDNNE